MEGSSFATLRLQDFECNLLSLTRQSYFLSELELHCSGDPVSGEDPSVWVLVLLEGLVQLSEGKTGAKVTQGRELATSYSEFRGLRLRHSVRGFCRGAENWMPLKKSRDAEQTAGWIEMHTSLNAQISAILLHQSTARMQ